MKKLCRKEILGMRPYIPGKPISDVKREYGLDKVVKLASNENPLGPSSSAKKAIIKAVDDLHLYPDGYVFNLRKKLSEKLNFEMKNFIFGDGTDEILECLFKAFVNNGDEVIFGDPSFVEYDRNTSLMGGTAIKISLTDDLRFDLKAIAKAITEKTKMIIICNPNNPTGTIVTKNELDKFMKGIPSNILIVFDEAYIEYASMNKDCPDSLDYQRKGLKNVITLRTFSKIYGLAGLRVGYGIADEEVIDLLERVRLPFNVTTLSQVGAMAALEDQDHIKNTIKVNEDGKSYLYSEFDKLGMNYIKTYTNFIFVDVKKTSSEIFVNLMKKGVIIRAMFGTYIRVTIGTEEENKFFIEKLKELV